MIPHHSDYIQILNADGIKPTHEVRTQFVQKILSPICDPFVQSGDLPLDFGAVFGIWMGGIPSPAGIQGPVVWQARSGDWPFCPLVALVRVWLLQPHPHFSGTRLDMPGLRTTP